MGIVIPEPNIHPDVAVNQHLVPQCYMREWSYNNGNSVWVYNKDEHFNEKSPENSNWTIGSKKTRNINSVNNFHDLKAGSPYLPEDALIEIFGFLSDFTISVDGTQLDTLRKMNQFYYQFSEWKIIGQDGLVIGENDRHKIEVYLRDTRYTYIETQWARTYENDWRSFISDIEQKVRSLKDSVQSGATGPQIQGKITQADIKQIMKYLLIYDWRTFDGYESFNEAFSIVYNTAYQALISEETDWFNLEYDTVMADLKHNIRLKCFIDFLKNDEGIIKKNVDMYFENMEICFLLTDSSYPFITSNTPSYILTRNDNMKEHILVARPTMLITLGRGDKNQFIVSKLSHSEVDIYNKNTAKHGDLLIVPSCTYDVSNLFCE